MSTAALCHSPEVLESRLRAIEPAARLVPSRHARRVARARAGEAAEWGFHPSLPIWIPREELAALEIVREHVLEGDEFERLLIVEPDDRIGKISVPDAELLRDYWRFLFRARMLRETQDPERLLASLSEDQVREIRFVLETEHVVAAGAPLAELGRVFAAVYADRVMFASETISTFFPSLPPTDEMMQLLGGESRLESIFKATRPDGAADPDPLLRTGHGPTILEEDIPVALGVEEEREPTRLLRRARRAVRVGNHVRAAILRTRAAERMSGPDQQRVSSFALSALHDGLVNRLREVLGWDYPTAKAWSRALIPLLAPAAKGVWPRAARVLFDLQKVAVDLEREIYSMEPIEWLRSFGQQPLRRPLTRARPVIQLHHFITAAGHLRRVPLAAADRKILDDLFESEIDRAEQAVRDQLAPVIRQTLDDVGLKPDGVLDDVAREKLIAELLDRLCERGFLRLGDLRDAIARNQCKIPDLQSPWEFFAGDPLLRADARLGEELHGVYRRGEIYLRWIQRLTALSFGTPIGRWVTRYIAIPFGGSFLTVEFAKYLAYEAKNLWGYLTGFAPKRSLPEQLEHLEETSAVDALAGPAAAEAVTDAIEAQLTRAAHAEHGIQFTPTTITAMVILGFVILSLVNIPTFRRAVVAALSKTWSGLVTVFHDWPLALWRSPAVVAIRRSRISRFISRHLGAGIIAGTTTWLVLLLVGTNPQTAAEWGVATFALMVLFVNSPTGRAASDWLEAVADDAWRDLTVNLIPGLVGWIQVLFRELAGLVERLLYAVDERLRFREGSTGESLVLKTILAAIWFPIAYTVRFAFTLLLEPQINPVKHFPVVTVSHKLLLPLIPSAASATGLSTGTVTLIIGGIPGIFGFIVWELKENWRLYAANRPVRQPPVVIGHHGETMRGLLRPGFHSGTVPKLYRRLRHAIEKHEVTGQPITTTRTEHELHEIWAAIVATVDRELIPLLRAATEWNDLSPRVGRINVGVRQVIVGIGVQEWEPDEFRLGFEQREGRILARVVDEGWRDRLTPEQREVLAVAVSGLVEKAAATWAEDSPKLIPAGPEHWSDRAAFWDAAAKPIPHPVGFTE